MPSLHLNWKTILKKAYSIRFMALAIVLSGLEVVLPYLDFLPIPPGSFAALIMLTTMAAFASRLYVQKDLNDGE